MKEQLEQLEKSVQHEMKEQLETKDSGNKATDGNDGTARKSRHWKQCKTWEVRTLKSSRDDLENISDLTFNPIQSQLINAFFDKRNFRQDEVGTVEEIGFEEFLTVMSHFRPLKQNLTQEDKEKIRREKLRFLFNMHDKDNDGFITLDEYRHLVEELLSKAAIEGETSKAIADAAMLEVASVTMGQMV
ncbi:tescalcin a [Tachysurus ichikawai]